MPAGQAVSGTDGKITIGTTTLYLDQYEFEETAGDIKTTNFESAGYEDGQTGVRVMTYKFKGYWDINNNPHASPPNLVAGQILSNVKLYTSRTSGLYASMPLARLLQIAVSVEVEGRVEFNGSGRSKGPFYLPGGISG